MQPSIPPGAMRLLKRWIWQREQEPGEPGTTISADLEELYAALADRAGMLTAGGADASRFAQESRREFEAVLWVPCSGRSVAQCAGELGAQLGLKLEGEAKENCNRIRNFLSERRCLVVLDAPGAEVRAALIAEGRTSTMVTSEPVQSLETAVSVAY